MKLQIWKVPEGRNHYDFAMEKLVEILNALFERYSPGYKIALCFDKKNRELFVSEPWVTEKEVPHLKFCEIMFILDDVVYKTNNMFELYMLLTDYLAGKDTVIPPPPPQDCRFNFTTKK